MPYRSLLLRAAPWLAFGSAVAIIFSIAVAHILLGVTLAAILLSGQNLRLPRIRLQLALFLVGTILAVLFSGDPAAGFPQIKKFYVFFELAVVFTALHDGKLIRWLFLAWAGCASLSGIVGIVQFAQKIEQAHAAGRDSYSFYVGERITGFMSHWNTFSAEEMYAMLMLGAFLFFAPVAKRLWLWIGCGVLMTVAVTLAETRAVWIGTAVAGAYLTWFWKRWLLLLAPVAAAAVFFLSPPVIRERITSIMKPKTVDSNAFRVVTWRTGVRMIEAHPILGLGPEMPRIHFDEYMPADIKSKPIGSYVHLHNVYLEYAAERGIPTLLVMLWMIGQIVWDFSRGLRSLPPGRSMRRFLLHGGIAVVIATLIEGVAEYNLGDSEVLTMFLVVVACGYLAIEKDVLFE